jgi:hypothetical protein
MKKFSAFYGPRIAITAFTTARHLFPSWARLIQSTFFRPVSLTSLLFPLSLPTYSKWSSSARFSRQNRVCLFLPRVSVCRFIHFPATRICVEQCQPVQQIITQLSPSHSILPPSVALFFSKELQVGRLFFLFFWQIYNLNRQRGCTGTMHLWVCSSHKVFVGE